MDQSYFKLLSNTLEDKERKPDNLSRGSFNQGYYQRFFLEKGKLGKGFGGSVFLCQHILDNVPLGDYAVKKVPVGDNHDWLMRMLNEVNILEKLKHPNVVDYKHAWLEIHQPTLFGPQIPCLFILMELADQGNLEDFILNQQSMKKESRNLIQRSRINLFQAEEISSFHDIAFLFRDVVYGLDHLHKQGIIHRDLKPANLLLSKSDNSKR